MNVVKGIIAGTHTMIAKQISDFIYQKIGCRIAIQLQEFNLGFPKGRLHLALDADAELDPDELATALCKKLGYDIDIDDLKVQKLNISMTEDGKAHIWLNADAKVSALKQANRK